MDFRACFADTELIGDRHFGANIDQIQIIDIDTLDKSGEIE